MIEPEVTKQDVTKQDVDEAIACFRKITRLAKSSTLFAKSISTKIELEHEDSSKGISFLELKNNVMLNYLMNLSHLMQRKVRGQP